MEIKKFSDSKIVSLEFQNPRRAGPGEYRVQVVLLVRLKTTKFVAPWIEVQQPRKGVVGIYYEKRRQDPMTGMADKLKMGIPVSAELDALVFLVRALNEETGWRYFEVSGDAMKQEKIAIPDLLTLKRLDDRKDGKELWGLYETANKEYHREREKR
jgi:hypothetical protein